jgi:hypothetical protein
MSNTKRWLEAGFQKYFDAKQAFGGLVQSAITHGVQPRALLPATTHEYLGWLLAGHPLWNYWSQFHVKGYAYDYFTLTSDTSQISKVCLGWVAEVENTFMPFSGYEALHGEQRPLEDRVRIAYAKEVQLLLSERAAKGTYVERPVDYNHLDRLINEFGIDYSNEEFFSDPKYFSPQFPYHIVNREYATSWREFVREASVQWGNKK